MFGKVEVTVDARNGGLAMPKNVEVVVVVLDSLVDAVSRRWNRIAAG